MPTSHSHYLEPTREAGRALFLRAMQGGVVMLNLLRLRAVADYSADPGLAPATPISGAEAFERYIAHTLPILHKSGGELLFLGEGGQFLIGPESERWDLAMLVRQSSIESFFAFAHDQDYLAGMGHRTAALVDARLLPLTQTHHHRTDRPATKKAPGPAYATRRNWRPFLPGLSGR